LEPLTHGRIGKGGEAYCGNNSPSSQAELGLMFFEKAKGEESRKENGQDKGKLSDFYAKVKAEESTLLFEA
jgi:hypothetical protein